MLNQRTKAFLLTAALALSLCGGAVLAAEEGQPDGSAGQPPVSQDTPAPQAPEAEVDGADVSAPEEPTAEAPEEPKPEPDPEGTVSFANLDDRVRAGCLNYRILQENVDLIGATDYEKMEEDMRDGLNQLADAQWAIRTSGSNIQTGLPPLDSALQGVVAISTASAAQSLDAQYDALREKYDDLKEGKLQQDMGDRVRQLQDTQNTILMATEGMYIQLTALNDSQAALDRSLTALDRQIQELELRYQMGQISALTLQEVKAGRASLVSGQETLDYNTRTLNMNLEAMLGTELTGQTRLGALPTVSGEELTAMDLEADLAAAKEASYALYDAKNVLDDAEQAFKDAGKEYGHNEKNYQYVQAKHSWQAAQYTYEGAVQSFELKFRTLYAQVKDFSQVLDAAKTTLAVKESNYAVAQLKHEQGTISKNALLTAQDEVSTAKDTVASARRDLFSAYNNYRWAVEHGILN